MTESKLPTGSSATHPSGLKLLTNFISAEEEKKLIDHIDSLPWSDELKRRTQQYGFVYKYSRGGSTASTSAAKTVSIPQLFQDLIIKKLVEQKIFNDQAPDQCIVNEYVAGQGIAPHIDDRKLFGDIICSLSMGFEYPMNFDPPSAPEGTKGKETKRLTMSLPRRSLLALTGEARHAWRHSIDAKTAGTVSGKFVKRGRRISITFRTMSYKSDGTRCYIKGKA